MIKRIMAGVFTLLLALFIAAPAASAVEWHYISSDPDHPVTLSGTGALKADGNGNVYYVVQTGAVNVSGTGDVAIKGTSNIVVDGLGSKKYINGWVVYRGTGTVTAKGTNFRLAARGNLHTEAIGNGKVTFRDWWNIQYTTLSLSGDHLNFPAELQ